MSLFAPSSSSGSSSVEYEVFISFRGSDTRNAFISHLEEALSQRKIVTFVDKKIPSGDEISSLFDTIEKSKTAVVIFSKDYASSEWCLKELVKILECKKRHGQIVIPVFYHVHPTDVRKQTGSYGKSFAEHKAKGIPVKTLQNWKDALKEASYLKGYETAVIRDEALLTKRIVDDIWKRLPVTYKIDNKNLVGIEPKVEKIKSLLNIGSGNFCVVGIWGIGGIGKTTLASAVFNEIQTQFGGSCFLRNIREESEKAGGLNLLRQQLYSDISGEKSGNRVDDSMLNRLLSRKKVLIVLDDVTDFKQKENIVGGVSGPNGESRIIITTRNRQVLRNCGCKEENIYEVNGLCDKEALQLFGRFAFEQEHPEEDYTELSRQMVHYAKGSPLALNVLGSHLHRKKKPIWKSAIERLKKAPDQEIQCVLKVSFDGLDCEQKDVFLDVACFFKWRKKEKIVNLYDESFEFTLDTLIDRCLVSIDSFGRITMHDLLQEMGLQIVREESRYPGERSRLRDYDDIYQVLTGNEGTRAIKCISFGMSETAMHLSKNSFINMSELWFLNINYSSDYSPQGEMLTCSEDFQRVSTKLRFLCWDYYPMKSLQSSFSPKKLVSLRMRYSKVEQLWNGEQPLPNLKVIDLSWSESLTAIPDLSLAPKLEEIYLCNCDNLTSLPPCNHLKALRKLDMWGCEKLVAIPELYRHDTKPFPNLKKIIFGSCLNLTAVPDFSLALELKKIDLSDCSNLSTLPPCNRLKSLRELNLSRCEKLVAIPELSCNIRRLNLEGTGITCLPSSIGNLSQLSFLDLSHCHELSFIPKEFSNLKSIEFLRLGYCRKLQFLPELPMSLKVLSARGCSSLEVMPNSLSGLLATTKEVSFSECYKLDMDIFITIIQDALLKIEQLPFRELPAQAIENKNGQQFFRNSSCVEYSGCEIPKIFEFQHSGSMISKELSHEMIGKIVGFAFFVVYKPRQLDEPEEVYLRTFLSIKFHCKTTFENSECFRLQDRFAIYVSDSISKEKAEDDSTVVVVGYTHTSDDRPFPSQYQSILLELEFSVIGCEVEKCGFKLFSDPVSEEEQKGTSTSSSEEKQLETSPKRLKIS